ncbi:hypothetical protein R1flu_021925 [Riccia fluitans]|uniref:FAS1 domain-containing protein n=1 Tax=Riccia fluitans TaxID=41844 RepID=A0ABD1ZRX4_9MARC
MACGVLAVLVWLSVLATTSIAQTPAPLNITAVLEKYPQFSQFRDLLISSGVDKEVNAHSSITLLAPANGVLSAFTNSVPNADVVKLGDIARFHFLLTYYTLADMKALPAENITIVTTLYQTTGRADGTSGEVEIFNLPDKVLVGPVDAGSNVTVVDTILEDAFVISILSIDSVLQPAGFNAGEKDLVKVLQSFQTFGLFITLLKDTGVDVVLANRQTSALTVFAPTDAAFSALNGSLQTLSDTRKKTLLEYHALTTYYTLSTLQTFVDRPVQTLASNGGGFALNISSDASTVILRTGVNNATVLQPLFNSNPASMYSVDEVLLPTEYFGTPDQLAPAEAPTPATAPAPTPIKAPTPAPAPATKAPAKAPAAGPVENSPLVESNNAANVVGISGALSALLVVISSITAFL